MFSCFFIREGAVVGSGATGDGIVMRKPTRRVGTVVALDAAVPTDILSLGARVLAVAGHEVV